MNGVTAVSQSTTEEEGGDIASFFKTLISEKLKKGWTKKRVKFKAIRKSNYVLVKWKSSPEATGYQIRWGTKNPKKFGHKCRIRAQKSKTIRRRLYCGRQDCYLKLRSFYKNGKKVKYGKWSRVKKIKKN